MFQSKFPFNLLSVKIFTATDPLLWLPDCSFGRKKTPKHFHGFHRYIFVNSLVVKTNISILWDFIPDLNGNREMMQLTFSLVPHVIMMSCRDFLQRKVKYFVSGGNRKWLKVINPIESDVWHMLFHYLSLIALFTLPAAALSSCRRRGAITLFHISDSASTSVLVVLSPSPSSEICRQNSS